MNIYEAIEKEDIKEVKRLLNLGVKLKPEEYARWKTEHYSRPLWEACQKGEIGVVKYIINTNTNTSNNEILEAMYIAIKNNNLDIAELLIDGGVELNFNASSLINLLVSQKCYNLIKMLLKHNKNDILINILQIAAIRCDDLELVDILLKSSTPGHNGEMLYLAIMDIKMNIANFLLENGVCIQRRVECNRALNIACKENNINIVNLLLKNGAVPNKTIINTARKMGNIEILKALLDK